MAIERRRIWTAKPTSYPMLLSMLAALCAFVPVQDKAPEPRPLDKSEGGGAWSNAFEYETERFYIRTDLPKDEAKAIAQQMDLLYAFVHKNFPDLKHASKKFVCYIFKDQKEYDEVMKKAHPDSVGRGGFYSHKDHFTHFFKHDKDSDVWRSILKTDPDADLDEYSRSVWLHETTHQILHECVGKSIPQISDKDYFNFWVVEGLPSYFESLRLKPDGGYDVGYPEHYRFRNLRKYFPKRLRDLDLEQLIKANRTEVFGERKTSQLNYHMTVMLSDFFFKFEDGKYREKFLKYAVEVHKGNVGKDLFKIIFGVEPSSLKEEWLKHIEQKLAG